MKKTGQQSEKARGKDSTKLARARANRKLFEEFGEIKLPTRIHTSRIQRERKKGMEAYRQERQRWKGKQFLVPDLIEIIKTHLRNKHPRPKTTSQLVSLLPYFDWRLGGIVPHARNQLTSSVSRFANRNASPASDAEKPEPCGSCWAFVATEAFESRLMHNLNKFRMIDPKQGAGVTQIALSVQGVLDCVTGGGCDGGIHTDAFDHFVKYGARILPGFNEIGMVIDNSSELLGKKGRCTEKEREGIRAIAWDFVFERNPRLVPKTEAEIRKMKKALLDHGPLAVLVSKGEGDSFDRYREERHLPLGVYNLNDETEVNHAVLLTGWDDERRAWIILNSFGSEWGGSCVDLSKARDLVPVDYPLIEDVLMKEKGCMYIGWGVNKIGKMAAWIETRLDNEKCLEELRSGKHLKDMRKESYR